MVVFSARAASAVMVSVLFFLVGPVPTASAQPLQEFHLLPDMSLGLSAGDELDVPITPIVGDDTSYWSRTMQHGGALLPESGTIQLRVDDANIAPAAGAAEFCPLTISVGIRDERYVYWCTWIDDLGTGVAPAGEYTVTFELNNPNIDPIAFSKGDELYVWLVSTSSQVAVPTVYAMSDSLVRLSGTSEPAEAPEPAGEPESTTTTSSEPSTTTTSSTPPSTTSSPAPTSSSSTTSTTADASPREDPEDPCNEGGCPAAPGQDATAEKGAPAASLAVLALALIGAVSVLRRRL